MSRKNEEKAGNCRKEQGEGKHKEQVRSRKKEQEEK